jgi:hypothetical protein
MKNTTWTGSLAVTLGLICGSLTACGGTDGGTKGSGGSNGSDGSSTAAGESGNESSSSSSQSSSSGESSSSSGTGGESSTSGGEGSGGASTTGEGESSTTGGGSGGAETDGESSSTDGGEGGAPEDRCPEERPGAEARCEVNGASCRYETDCGSRTLTCREGQWRNTPTDDDVDTCENDGFRCGPGEGEEARRCERGQVCVATRPGGDAASYECAENPCEGDQATSCDCAAKLCGETDELECRIREEGLVVACVPAGD